MKILVLNCGSSSIKYALYDMTDKSVITSGGIEKIGLPDSFIKVKLNGEKQRKHAAYLFLQILIRRNVRTGRKPTIGS